MTNNNTVNRRKMLRQSVGVLACTLTLPILLVPRSARAGSASKDDFHYQDTPHEQHRCTGCSAFVASPEKPDAAGGCRIIAGAINPNGWCMAYSAK